LDENVEKVYNCSGCSGRIKFSLLPVGTPKKNAGTGGLHNIAAAVKRTFGKPFASPLIRTFPVERVDTILEKFKKIDLDEGVVLIRKGSPNLYIFIVFEGELLVDDAGVELACLSEGEVSGKIGVLVPAELFQVFHMHQKTGVSTMDLPGGTDKIAFREGCITNAAEVGDFMSLLMEGVKRVDEGQPQ